MRTTLALFVAAIALAAVAIVALNPMWSLIVILIAVGLWITALDRMRHGRARDVERHARRRRGYIA